MEAVCRDPHMHLVEIYSEKKLRIVIGLPSARASNIVIRMLGGGLARPFGYTMLLALCRIRSPHSCSGRNQSVLPLKVDNPDRGLLYSVAHVYRIDTPTAYCPRSFFRIIHTMMAGFAKGGEQA
jgi:hypothetical protein